MRLGATSVAFMERDRSSAITSAWVELNTGCGSRFQVGPASASVASIPANASGHSDRRSRADCSPISTWGRSAGSQTASHPRLEPRRRHKYQSSNTSGSNNANPAGRRK